jgi:ABC-type spermidine/putrescine transport system permease subunit I
MEQTKTNLIFNKLILIIVISIIIAPAIAIFIRSIIVIEDNELVKFAISYFDETFENLLFAQIKIILIRSILISLISLIIGYFITFYIELFISKPKRNFFLYLIGFLFILNLNIRIFNWKNFLAFHINDFLLKTKLIEMPDASLGNSDIYVYLISIFNSIPIVIFILIIGFSIINRSIWLLSEEIDLSDFYKMKFIIIPNIWPTLIIVFIVLFIFNISLYSEVSFLGGDSKVTIDRLINSLYSGDYKKTFFVGNYFIMICFVIYQISKKIIPRVQ